MASSELPEISREEREDIRNAMLDQVAVVAQYERALADPRFRGRRLREVAMSGSGEPDLQTATPNKHQLQTRAVPTRSYVWVKEDDGKPDTPANVVSKDAHISVKRLSEDELEDIYWQARNFDGCTISAVLMRQIFDLLDERVTMTALFDDGDGVMDKTLNAKIIEFELIEPRKQTLHYMLPEGECHSVGTDPTSPHVVLCFSGSTVLDMSPSQFDIITGKAKGGLYHFVTRLQTHLRLLTALPRMSDFVLEE